ncbi:sugar porter family MFS transporter [Stappia taiwanensis]|uniref:Sugar porter family MFS transporter n=1 Tax=Stappia taiwanensis TaxID=992267 RepID=A0A838XLP4_9HYPH|nr:sugar porter family MFS transporter [Stappia taiwanensis]MBA4610767.1 sugar porter family MFS transporter [Stappia taiwanensis]GGE96079.1 MFS transporter [Stappia taiwanensis]
MLIRLVALAALFGFLFGFDEGVIAGALPFITKLFGITAAGEGMVTSAVPLGAVAGAILAAIWADALGRRMVLIICSLLFGIGALASGLASGEVVLVVARLMLGIAIGASALAAPMFLAELAPARQRGAVVSAFQLMITIGILVSYLIDMMLEPLGAWRWMLALGAVPAIVTLGGIWFAPESPRWLVMRGRNEEAETVIAAVQPELGREAAAEIVRDIAASQASAPKSADWSQFLSERMRPIASFAIIAFLLQQVSGINAVIYYAPTILGHAGFDGASTQLAATVGIGIVNVLMTVVAMFIVDRLGRRPLFIIGFLGAAASLAVIALTMNSGNPEMAPVALVGLFVYIAFFAVSLGPLPWIYMSELFPLSMRSRGMAMASVANWGCNFLVVFLFPVVVAAAGAAVTFAIFCGFCVLGAIYAWARAPETKGASLEDLEKRGLAVTA